MNIIFERANRESNTHIPDDASLLVSFPLRLSRKRVSRSHSCYRTVSRDFWILRWKSSRVTLRCNCIRCSLPERERYFFATVTLLDKSPERGLCCARAPISKCTHAPGLPGNTDRRLRFFGEGKGNTMESLRTNVPERNKQRRFFNRSAISARNMKDARLISLFLSAVDRKCSTNS